MYTNLLIDILVKLVCTKGGGGGGGGQNRKNCDVVRISVFVCSSQEID